MRASWIQFLTSAGLFASILYLPSYLEVSLGASEAFVGVVVSAYALATFVAAAIFGRLADIRGRRFALLLGLASSAIVAALQFVAPDPYTLLLVRVLLGFSTGIYPAALLAYAHDMHQAMGKFASWGSLGWGLGSAAAAVATLWIQDPGALREIFLLSATLMALSFLLALMLAPTTAASPEVPLFPIGVLRRHAATYGAMLIRHTGANMVWVIFPLYLEQDLHLTKFEVGILYFINSFVQFIAMQYLGGYGGRSLFIAGMAVSAITFFSFTLAKDFWTMAATQVVLGISWGTIYVGALKQVLEDEEKATAAGLLGSSIAIAATVGPFLGGLASHAAGRVVPMYAASVLAVTSLGLYLWAKRKHPSKPNPSSGLAG